MNPTRRSIIKQAAAIGCGAFTGLSANAQPDESYPSKPIRIIVPWTPGAPADGATRILAEHMAASMKQSIVVDNKPGAGGTVGYQEALRQPADGYTIYILSSASFVAPLLYPTRPPDFLRDLSMVGHVHWSYNALVTSPQSELKSVKDIAAAARAHPGQLSFASGGNGTPAHIAGAMLEEQAGARMVHVPYQQFMMAINDVLGGRISYMFMAAGAAIPFINSGKMRGLAVTSAHRLPALPQVPTMVELGYPDFVFRSFETLSVRTGTPRPVIERLSRELNQALALPDVKEKFQASGWECEPMSPTQVTQLVTSESERWLRVGRMAQITAN